MDRIMVDVTTLSASGKILPLIFIGFFRMENDKGWLYQIQDSATTISGDISGDYDSHLDMIKAAIIDSERAYR